MSYQDKTSDIVVNHQYIKQVADWLLMPALFAGMKTKCTATWLPRMLAVTALLWAVGEQTNLTDRFETARKVVGKIFRWRPAPGETYQGFMKMLRKWHVRLKLAIIPHAQVQMREVLPNQWEIAGYVVYAGDGSRVEVGRTQSLEEAFSPKRKKEARKTKSKKGQQTKQQGKQNDRAKQKQSEESVAKKENSPQMWLTLIWHVGTGLPWTWRTGSSDSSERAHLQEMLAELVENSLITADAGFVGYDFWAAILHAKHNFLIRVGSNVRLLKKLGYARQHAQTVYLWPDSAGNKKQPPLVLRLIVVHNGKHPVYLVTNLTKSQLSDSQAASIYSARWGIELYFRTFKQTFGRRKLRSRSAKNANLELDWSIIGLWCICLLGQRELKADGADPASLSPAAAIRAFQQTIREYRVRPERREETLWFKLRLALLDEYQRPGSKTSRNYPRKKKRQYIQPPKVEQATKSQIKLAQHFRAQQQEFRLPA